MQVTWTTNEVRKTARIRNQYNQVPHLSQDTKWESNKIILNITNKSQEVSPSLQVTTRQQWTDGKAWQTQGINNTNDPQKKYHLGTLSKNILLECLKPVSRHANLILSSDVNQDT